MFTPYCWVQCTVASTVWSTFYKKQVAYILDFPGGPVAKNPLAHAGERVDPWSGKIPRVEGQPYLCTSYWACALEPVLGNQRNTAAREFHALQLESSFCSPQLEKAQQRRCSAAKNKIKNFFKKQITYILQLRPLLSTCQFPSSLASVWLSPPLPVQSTFTSSGEEGQETQLFVTEWLFFQTFH